MNVIVHVCFDFGYYVITYVCNELPLEVVDRKNLTSEPCKVANRKPNVSYHYVFAPEMG